MHKFEERVTLEVQLAETEEEIQGHRQVKLENARRE